MNNWFGMLSYAAPLRCINPSVNNRNVYTFWDALLSFVFTDLGAIEVGV